MGSSEMDERGRSGLSMNVDFIGLFVGVYSLLKMYLSFMRF